MFMYINININININKNTMNILFLDVNQTQSYCNYYYDVVKYLAKKNNVKHMKLNFRRNGIYKISQITNTLEKFNQNLKNQTNQTNQKQKQQDLDYIILGYTFFSNQLPNLITDTQIPIIVILNKEYTELKTKLDWIKSLKPNQPKKILSVHHLTNIYQEYTKIQTYRIMWSADEEIFKDYKEPYEYDVYFSGVIRKEQTDNYRNKIFRNLQYLHKKYPDIKFKINARFQENNYQGKIFSTEEYAKNLARSKICITTTGPADLVGTRYFEIMATNRALIFCNDLNTKNSEIYENMFIDTRNCIMFKSIEDFNKKLLYYLEHENERMKIVNQAFNDFNNKLSYYKQIEKIENILKI